MVCFIRDIATWAHIAQCEVVSYNVPLYSVEDVSGKIRIAGEHPEYSRCWVIIDGAIFYGDSASPSDGTTELSVSRPMNAFGRSLVYSRTFVYEPTTDATFDSEKKYFEKTDAVKHVRSIDNVWDQNKEYFLKDSGGNFFHANITAFEYGAVYYQKTADASYQKTSDISMNPLKKYYEKSGTVYTVTRDKSFVYGKNYYERISDPTYTKTSDSAYNSSHIYYIQDARSKYIQLNTTDFAEDGIYYEAVNYDKYSVTTDDSFVAGKTYYELVNDYGGIGTEVLETFIKHAIEDSFVNEPDPMYAMPYIVVDTIGETIVDLSYEVNEVYSFLDIIDLAYEKKILFAFTMTATNVMIHIFPAPAFEYNVFFGDGHNFLEDVTVSNELVARVTVRRIENIDDGIEVFEERDFYWHKGGEITETPPEPRIKGIWDIVSVDDENTELKYAAEEAMADNDEAVKVTFYSDGLYLLGDKITCPVNNEVITEAITSCFISSDDSRRLYSLGKMPTTLTDKFEQAASENDTDDMTVSSTYEAKSGSYLAKTGGSVNGNLGVQDTMSTNKMVVGANSYGSSLPEKGQTGQLFFVLST